MRRNGLACLISLILLGCVGSPRADEYAHRSPASSPRSVEPIAEKEPAEERAAKKPEIEAPVAKAPQAEDQPARPHTETEADRPSLRGLELLQQCAEYVSRPARAVTDRGRPLGVTADLDGDGIEEAFLLTLETVDPSRRLLRNLSDFTKLFEEEVPSLPVFIEYFRQEPQIVSTSVIALGSIKVLEHFGPLSAERPDKAVPDATTVTGLRPFGLEIIAPGPAGRERRWVLFQPTGAHEIFTFQENARRTGLIRDIDENGVLDLLLFETAPEEGIGLETYIHWYRWTGRTYHHYRSVNVLRNLRAFLRRTRDTIINANWRRLIDTSLRPEDAAAYRSQPIGELIRRLFQPASFGRDIGHDPSQEGPLSLGDRISDVIFPNLLESPIRISDGEIVPVLLPVKIVSAVGEAYYYGIRLTLNDNPFAARQFVFLLH